MGIQSNTIYGIELKRLTTSISRSTTALFDIYLGQTMLDTFASSNNWKDPASMTRVFTGQYRFNAGQQFDTIIFDQPYQYRSSQNLVFTIFEHSDTLMGTNSILFYGNNTSGNEGVCLHYLKYGYNQVDMNHADRWNNAVASKWSQRYNIKFFTSHIYIDRECPMVEANYQTSLNTSANILSTKWKTYGSQGCWWEYHGADTGTMVHTHNYWGVSKLGSPAIETNPNGTSMLSFEFLNSSNTA